MTTICLVVLAYIVGLAAARIMPDALRQGEKMRIRDWVITVLIGWLMVGAAVTLYIGLPICFGFEWVLKNGWKKIKSGALFLRKAW